MGPTVGVKNSKEASRIMRKYGNAGNNLYRLNETILINNISKILENDLKC